MTVSGGALFAFSLLIATAAAAPSSRNNDQVISDISTISNYWGQITPYADNAPGYFGVKDTGLPNGCGVEQVHVLHRHGSRYATDGFDDAGPQITFSKKVAALNAANKGSQFTGPLSFLSGYSYRLEKTGLLVATGASQEFASGANFWNKYGRLLYTASAGQPFYNASFFNGTARPKPVLRTTSQARILQSARFWAEGFFGWQGDSANISSLYDLVVIPEDSFVNNTLAAYYSCDTDNFDENFYYKGDFMIADYIAKYLSNAQQRLAQYVPANFNLTLNDTYAMQSLCAYETSALGSSDFCGLFTLPEWQGFEYTLDTEYCECKEKLDACICDRLFADYDYAFGNPTGRAQGIGYLQELIARLSRQYITSSNSSVNSTLDSSAKTFPLDQPFYLDMSHDDILISALTAMSLDYLRGELPQDAVPPNPKRAFFLSHLTPFAARLTTEVIGCNSANPAPKQYPETHYTLGTNGYVASNSSQKFIRMRLNDGILPLTTIRGGYCTRSDGLCSLSSFLQSQVNSTALANCQSQPPYRAYSQG